MAYPYGYGYQPFMPSYAQGFNPQPEPIRQTPAQPVADDRIWVQGEAAATSYLVAPNGFVRLWDSERPVFYEKRSDATGRPLPIECYTYTRTSGTPHREEPVPSAFENSLKALEERVAALEKKGDADNV